MADNFSAGLTDQDELSQFPSAANPLTALGIDPDMARANPDLLNSLNPSAPVAPVAKMRSTGPVSMPTGEPAPTAAPSAVAAGKAGGAGDAAPVQAPTATDYGMAGLQTLKQNAEMATKAAGDITTSSPQVEQLQAERGKLATQPPLYDPKTGKMLNQTEEYDPKTGQNIAINPKPTTGTRIWRGVRGGLNGLLTGGIRGGLLGAIEPGLEGSQAYGAPNDAFQKAEEQRGQELASTDAGLKTAFDNWKAQQDAAKARASEFRANAGLGKDLTTGATGMENAATSAQKETDEAANQRASTPEARDAAALKLNQQQFDQRTSRVSSMPNLSPLQKTLYILNGKIPDPQQPNEAEITAGQAARALTVFKLQHNGQGPQTLEDFNSIQAAARGGLDRGKNAPASDDEISSVVADATGKKQEFADKYDRNPDGTYSLKSAPYDPKTTLSADAFQHRLDQFRVDANTKLAKKHAQIDAQGNIVRTGSGAKPSSADAPQTDVVTVRDGNGNVGTLPRANLAAAQKRDPKLSVVTQ